MPESSDGPKEVGEAEQALIKWGIEYKKNPDGSILAPGDLDLSSKHLTKLPALSRVVVGLDFFCDNNQLTSLEGAPAVVGRGFYCSYNQLTSLKHAPAYVGDGVWCRDNELTSLEGAPPSFKRLSSDFGDFPSWDAVPENLRLSPETKARLEQEKIQHQEQAVNTSQETAPGNSGKPMEILLRGAFADVTVRANGVNVEIHADGSVNVGAPEIRATSGSRASSVPKRQK
jgi:hypothetical protein